MSLALWEFFWDWGGVASPPPSPPPPSAPATPLPGPPSDNGGGGGRGHDKPRKKQREYTPSPEDLWDFREQYLRSLQPAPPPAPRPEEYEAESNREYLARQQQLEKANADRSAALIAMQGATDIKALKSYGSTIKELNAKIATLTNKQAFTRFMRK